jgi:alpha-D-ribose 1-methylphosphonate 5-triphosphate synthase subunit PhnH
VNAPLDGRGLMPGFSHPVFDGQRVFRAVLKTVAHPGTIVHLPLAPRAPGTLCSAATAYCLTLLDFETPLWLQRADAGLAAYLRFHCGCPLTETPAQARFALIADPGSMPSLSEFHPGEPEYPDRSATLLIQVASLEEGEAVRLTGPGIRESVRFSVSGLSAGFWAQVRENHALFPCGVDMVFACGDALAALPRSTRVEV